MSKQYVYKVVKIADEDRPDGLQFVDPLPRKPNQPVEHALKEYLLTHGDIGSAYRVMTPDTAELQVYERPVRDVRPYTGQPEDQGGAQGTGPAGEAKG